MKLKIPELNTKQAITIALLIGLLYTGAYIYDRYRLTIEHRDSIKKWCMTNVLNNYRTDYYFEGKDRWEKVDNCINHFGK